MRLLVLALCAFLGVACTSVPKGAEGWIEPEDAIRGANNDPSYGVRGDFVLSVKAIGSEHGWTFLNSERDYRDQRNLTIKMPTSMVPKLEQRLGLTLQNVKNRRIVVQGVARRVRIDFIANKQPTGKYYYQTHVLVDSPTQIRLAE